MRLDRRSGAELRHGSLGVCGLEALRSTQEKEMQ